MVDAIYGHDLEQEYERVQGAVKRALEAFYCRDGALLDRALDVNERSISHRLALHLQQVFGEAWDVDCEYNRNLNMVKRLPRHLANGPIRWDDTDAHTIYPDIVVHKRGTNTHNLLVIEMKKQNGPLPNADYEKLAQLLATCDAHLELPPDSQDMWYRYTLFLRLGTRDGRPDRLEGVWRAWNERSSSNVLADEDSRRPG